ncbi:MAG: cytochrome c [Bacteroidota bacterium]
MKTRNISLLLLASLSLIYCQPIAEEDSTQYSQFIAHEENTSAFEIDLLNLSFFLDTIEVKIKKDMVFKQEKHYQAFELRAILDRHLKQNKIDTSGIELVLVCKDGYRPSIPITSIYKGAAYLAFNDLSQQESWVDEAKFAPYYLVWGDEKHTAKGNAWPYGLVAIELVQKKDLFANAYPHHKPEVQQGFELFKKNCMKCHSVNKVGGNMGPEFNYPKNITEYWSRKDILAFVQNPFSFRYNSKMRPVKHLQENELMQIVDYLEYMVDQKLGD